MFLGFLVISDSLLHLYKAPIGTQWLLLAFLTLVSGSASVYLPWRTSPFPFLKPSRSPQFCCTVPRRERSPSLWTASSSHIGWLAEDPKSIELFSILRRLPYQPGHPPSFFLPFWHQSTCRCAGKSAYEPRQDIAVARGVRGGVFTAKQLAHRISDRAEETNQPVDSSADRFIWLSLNYFCGASVAILLVGYNRVIDLRFVGVVVPLLLVLYFTFKTSTERVADANRHVDQLNTLYLSTIETLAMAIDAKDQITHGHIRRVQS